jgi:DNA-binding IclR family transcriptional regulator
MSDGVRSVHRALDLLERFDDEHPAWTLAALTHASGLPKTTVLRLVTTLEQRGLVAAIGPGRYAIGPGFLRWSRLSSASMEIPPAVRAAMGKLAADTGETANLYIRVGRTRVCLAQAQGSSSVRHTIAVGSSLPLWGGAASKVLLADPPVLEADPSVIEEVAVDAPRPDGYAKELRSRHRGGRPRVRRQPRRAGVGSLRRCRSSTTFRRASGRRDRGRRSQPSLQRRSHAVLRERRTTLCGHDLRDWLDRLQCSLTPTSWLGSECWTSPTSSRVRLPATSWP